MEWSGVERSGVEWSGVEWSGVEWSGVEWSGLFWRIDKKNLFNLKHILTVNVSIDFIS